MQSPVEKPSARIVPCTLGVHTMRAKRRNRVPLAPLILQPRIARYTLSLALLVVQGWPYLLCTILLANPGTHAGRPHTRRGKKASCQK